MGAENSSASWLPEALEKWKYYLDVFSSYPLCTWLLNIYHKHDN